MENYVYKFYTIKNFIFNLRNGKLVDPSPEIISEQQSELEKLNVQYGGGKGVDMTQFPQFKFDGTQFWFICLLNRYLLLLHSRVITKIVHFYITIT